jgi:hypothetical protein
MPRTTTIITITMKSHTNTSIVEQLTCPLTVR